MRSRNIFTAMALSGFMVVAFACSCSKKSSGDTGGTTPPVTPPVTPPATTNQVDYWVTTGSQSSLLQKQAGTLAFGTTANLFSFVDVDSAVSYQTVDGFGYTLTGGSATLINNLSTKASLLQELFGNTDNSIGVNYLRIAMGASDLSASVFSYDDMAAGQTDVNLDHFNLSLDTVDLIPLLKEILTINPNIKILATPWSPPVWMKDNTSSIGGSLLPQYYAVYANYFVKYIQAMQAKGIRIEAITPQNEPLNPNNNPSMVMTAAQQAAFIKTDLGPAFQVAGITTKIIIWDHNCDRSDYPMDILNDPAAKAFVDGSAFHLYAGDISAMGTVHNAFPDKNVYFTEQYTSSTGGFEGDLKWHMKNVVIGSMNNWSKVALEWNLANDPTFGPHTNGGCTECKGALTIGSGGITKNVAYYIIAQASKFIPAGSVRIGTTTAATVTCASFKRPDGKKVLLALNEAGSAYTFNIRYKAKWVQVTVPASSASTFIW